MHANLGWTACAVKQLRRRAFWVAAAFVVLGVASVVLLVAKAAPGGVSALEAARLGVLVPILVACAMAAVVVLAARRVPASPRVFLSVAAMTAGIGSMVIPFLALGSRAWASMIPLEYPTGIDFRAGLYDSATAFSTADSGWPPLTVILGRLFALFSPAVGYRLHVLALVVLGLAAVVLSVELGRRATGLSAKSPRPLLFAFGVWLFASYGFLFEVERGNINVYALVFALLAVWALLRFPKSAWVPAILLAIAINLKVYPAILLILVCWRHRWRAIVPVVVSNAALLLIAGPGNAWAFLKANWVMQSHPSLWLGNHSAESFTYSLNLAHPWVPLSMKYVFLAASVALWLVTAIVLIRRGWSQRGAVLLAAASVPLMNIVPAVSHDYKLVLLVFPLVVLGALLVEPGGSRLGSPVWQGVLLGLMGLEMAGLTVPTKFWGDGLQYPATGFGNKYPLVVFVQLLLLVAVLLLRREDDPEYGGVVASKGAQG
jgi:hypothetical protein